MMRRSSRRKEQDIRIDHASVTTAGAYVRIAGRYLFAVGPSPVQPSLAIYRLGGHREAGETPWACAAREVFEEAGVRAQLLPAPATYLLDAESPTIELRSVAWHCDDETPEAPLLIVEKATASGHQRSVMYLATAEETPTPSAEVRGLLLLQPAEIRWLTQQAVTLADFRAAGGHALLREALPESLPLEPLLQARVLAHLLNIHPDLDCPPL